MKIGYFQYLTSLVACREEIIWHHPRCMPAYLLDKPHEVTRRLQSVFAAYRAYPQEDDRIIYTYVYDTPLQAEERFGAIILEGQTYVIASLPCKYKLCGYRDGQAFFEAMAYAENGDRVPIHWVADASRDFYEPNELPAPLLISPAEAARSQLSCRMA